MPEPLQVLANLSGSAHADNGCTDRSEVRSFEFLSHWRCDFSTFAEGDRERQGRITVVGSPGGGTHHNRDRRSTSET